MRLSKTIILGLAFATGGCSVLEYQPLAKETLKNSNGHVIGYTERLCDCKAGEELDRVVLRDLNGKRIGARYVDLRSRGSNARNSGLTIVFVPKDAERLAQVTIEDIRQHLRISN